MDLMTKVTAVHAHVDDGSNIQFLSASDLFIRYTFGYNRVASLKTLDVSLERS